MSAHDNNGSPGQDHPPTDITDIAQLQEQIGKLLDRFNKDQPLAMAAAVNPLLALEELGYRLAPAVRREIERRSRYTKRQLVRLESLRAELLQAVPDFPIEEFDVLSSPAGAAPTARDPADSRRPDSARPRLASPPGARPAGKPGGRPPRNSCITWLAGRRAQRSAVCPARPVSQGALDASRMHG